MADSGINDNFKYENEQSIYHNVKTIQRSENMENLDEPMEELQALIGEDLEKYHEEKIKRDLGEEHNPKPGMKKMKIPQALLRQYFELN